MRLVKLLIIFISCLGLIDQAQASCKQQAQVALAFMNGYVAYSQAIMGSKTTMNTASWLGKFPHLAADFIPAYKKLEAQGREQDAELSWGMDLIFDAQDYPDQGFQLLRCKANDLVELRGRDWPEFTVAVKTVKQQGRYLVAGAGRVNLSASERAQR